jgi:hypothetical protein
MTWAVDSTTVRRARRHLIIDPSILMNRCMQPHHRPRAARMVKLLGLKSAIQGDTGVGSQRCKAAKGVALRSSSSP